MEHGYLLRSLPRRLEPLIDLALDLRWTWSHVSDALWQRINPDMWQRTQNPWLILQSVTRERLDELCRDERFLAQLDELLAESRQYRSPPDWFSREHAGSGLRRIAYFSMEYGLSEAFPLYAGGLGVLAGDHLKAASDLGVPVVALGLFYQQGYFRQLVDAGGWQHEFYPYNDPVSLPIRPATEANGDWLRIHLPLPGRTLALRIWEVKIGSVQLYLLDSNDPMNSPVDRGITGELYGGGREQRLLQELVLGSGGWRVLATLGIEPEVCHLNEGHTAFAALERLRDFAGRGAADFDTALWATRAGNIFTTHTPVAAGFDCFAPALVAQYLRDYAEQLHTPLEQLLALGQAAAGGDEPFNMAYLAVRLCGAVNGVSRLHGTVSRRLFQPLYPRWPRDDVPIGHVTNAVHTPSWDSSSADRLWTESCGKARWLGTLETLRRDIEAVPEDVLWAFRSEGRQRLVGYVRQRLSLQLGARGAGPEALEGVAGILDPNALTLGFARRFATYKRPDLLLHDEDRLIRLLTDPRRPVQLVIAGKAHPDDAPGKQMIRRWVAFAQRPELRQHVVFLSDYDIVLAEQLTQGVDLWINTPRRPWEACGTSGMKVLVNGGLNLSALDGWWAEAYRAEVGWALGDGLEHADPAWDAIEAEQLYRLLEDEVVPCFYTRDAQGIPTAWVTRIRASMATLTPRFSANRMLREYLADYYLPAALAYRRRAADTAQLASALAQWQRDIRRHWSGVHFLHLGVDTRAEVHHFTVQLYLDELPPERVCVEIYAEAGGGRPGVRQAMRRTGVLQGAVNGYSYEADVPADRPAQHYTPRVIPWHAEARVPAEDAHILWLR